MVAGKFGTYVHDDTPNCEVEVMAVWCGNCKERGIIYHAVCGCELHGVEPEMLAQIKQEHSKHTCGQPYQVVPLIDGEPDWPV